MTVSGTTTLRAVAYVVGAESPVSSAAYAISGTVATPSLSPGGGSYTAVQSVSLSTATAGAAILYTLDGSTPTAGYGTVYNGVPLAVGTTVTIKAIAYKSGLTASMVAGATYTFGASSVSTPTFNPAAGTYADAQSIGTRVRRTRSGEVSARGSRGRGGDARPP